MELSNQNFLTLAFNEMFAFFNCYACRPVMTISLLKIMVTSLKPAMVNPRATQGMDFFLKIER